MFDEEGRPFREGKVEEEGHIEGKDKAGLVAVGTVEGVVGDGFVGIIVGELVFSESGLIVGLVEGDIVVTGAAEGEAEDCVEGVKVGERDGE